MPPLRAAAQGRRAMPPHRTAAALAGIGTRNDRGGPPQESASVRAFRVERLLPVGEGYFFISCWAMLLGSWV